MSAKAADLGVCRWSLECTTDATTVVEHTSLGPYPACGEHADEHAAWRQRGADAEAAGRVFIHASGHTSPMPPGEPEPECWCPTIPRRKVPYCPKHGTLEQRGIDPQADDQ